MGVKVRERNGAWWIYVDYRGQRKAKRVGVGRAGKKAADAAAIKIQARLALGDEASVFDGKRGPVLTFKEIAEEWLAK